MSLPVSCTGQVVVRLMHVLLMENQVFLILIIFLQCAAVVRKIKEMDGFKILVVVFGQKVR